MNDTVRPLISDAELDAIHEAEVLVAAGFLWWDDAYQLLRLTLARYDSCSPEGAWLLRRAFQILDIEPRPAVGRQVPKESV